MADQLGVFTLCDPDFDQLLASGAAAGFRRLALYFAPGRLPYELETLTDAQASDLRSRCAAHGLAPAAAGGGSDVLSDEGLDLLRRKLDGAARLGVGVFDTGSLATKDKAPEIVEEQTARFCEGMARAGDLAGARGVVICLETHGGLTGTVPSSLDLMERLDHPNVKIGYDPANIVYYEGASPLDELEALVPWIGHVHVKDQRGGQGSADFPTVGKGDVPYDEVLTTLRQAGYAGGVSVERAPGETAEQRARELKDAYAFLERYFD